MVYLKIGVCSWLRHCATSRKVMGSTPDGVTGTFYWHNPSGRTMALGLTQPLTEMSTRNISWGVRAASAYGWQPYHLHVLNVLKPGSLNLMELTGPVQAFNGIALPLLFHLPDDGVTNNETCSRWLVINIFNIICAFSRNKRSEWGEWELLWLDNMNISMNRPVVSRKIKNSQGSIKASEKNLI